MESPATGAKRIRPSLPHVPVGLLPSVAHTVRIAFPVRSTRFNLPSAKNSSDRPSGDQKADVAPSVPVTGRASKADKGRSQIRVGPAGAVATRASWDPSGERARKVFSGPFTNADPTGGETENRTDVSR